MPLWLLILVLCVVFAFLVVGYGASTEGHGRHRTRPDRDDAALEDAESDVGQLGATVTPDDADDHLPDWGPGAPKRPRS